MTSIGNAEEFYKQIATDESIAALNGLLASSFFKRYVIEYAVSATHQIYTNKAKTKYFWAVLYGTTALAAGSLFIASRVVYYVGANVVNFISMNQIGWSKFETGVLWGILRENGILSKTIYLVGANIVNFISMDDIGWSKLETGATAEMTALALMKAIQRPELFNMLDSMPKMVDEVLDIALAIASEEPEVKSDKARKEVEFALPVNDLLQAVLDTVKSIVGARDAAVINLLKNEKLLGFMGDELKQRIASLVKDEAVLPKALKLVEIGLSQLDAGELAVLVMELTKEKPEGNKLPVDVILAGLPLLKVIRSDSVKVALGELIMLPAIRDIGLGFYEESLKKNKKLNEEERGVELRKATEAFDKVFVDNKVIANVVELCTQLVEVLLIPESGLKNILNAFNGEEAQKWLDELQKEGEEKDPALPAELIKASIPLIKMILGNEIIRGLLVTLLSNKNVVYTINIYLPKYKKLIDAALQPSNLLNALTLVDTIIKEAGEKELGVLIDALNDPSTGDYFKAVAEIEKNKLVDIEVPVPAALIKATHPILLKLLSHDDTKEKLGILLKDAAFKGVLVEAVPAELEALVDVAINDERAIPQVLELLKVALLTLPAEELMPIIGELVKQKMDVGELIDKLMPVLQKALGSEDLKRELVTVASNRAVFGVGMGACEMLLEDEQKASAEELGKLIWPAVQEALPNTLDLAMCGVNTIQELEKSRNEETSLVRTLYNVFSKGHKTSIDAALPALMILQAELKSPFSGALIKLVMLPAISKMGLRFYKKSLKEKEGLSEQEQQSLLRNATEAFGKIFSDDTAIASVLALCTQVVDILLSPESKLNEIILAYNKEQTQEWLADLIKASMPLIKIVLGNKAARGLLVKLLSNKNVVDTINIYLPKYEKLINAALQPSNLWNALMLVDTAINEAGEKELEALIDALNDPSVQAYFKAMAEIEKKQVPVPAALIKAAHPILLKLLDHNDTKEKLSILLKDEAFKGVLAEVVPEELMGPVGGFIDDKNAIPQVLELLKATLKILPADDLMPVINELIKQNMNVGAVVEALVPVLKKALQEEAFKGQLVGVIKNEAILDVAMGAAQVALVDSKIKSKAKKEEREINDEQEILAIKALAQEEIMKLKHKVILPIVMDKNTLPDAINLVQICLETLPTKLLGELADSASKDDLDLTVTNGVKVLRAAMSLPDVRGCLAILLRNDALLSVAMDMYKEGLLASDKKKGSKNAKEIELYVGSLKEALSQIIMADKVAPGILNLCNATIEALHEGDNPSEELTRLQKELIKDIPEGEESLVEIAAAGLTAIKRVIVNQAVIEHLIGLMLNPIFAKLLQEFLPQELRQSVADMIKDPDILPQVIHLLHTALDALEDEDLIPVLTELFKKDINPDKFTKALKKILESELVKERLAGIARNKSVLKVFNNFYEASLIKSKIAKAKAAKKEKAEKEEESSDSPKKSLTTEVTEEQEEIRLTEDEILAIQVSAKKETQDTMEAIWTIVNDKFALPNIFELSAIVVGELEGLKELYDAFPKEVIEDGKLPIDALLAGIPIYQKQLESKVVKLGIQKVIRTPVFKEVGLNFYSKFLTGDKAQDKLAKARNAVTAIFADQAIIFQVLELCSAIATNVLTIKNLRPILIAYNGEQTQKFLSELKKKPGEQKDPTAQALPVELIKASMPLIRAILAYGTVLDVAIIKVVQNVGVEKAVVAFFGNNSDEHENFKWVRDNIAVLLGVAKGMADAELDTIIDAANLYLTERKKEDASLKELSKNFAKAMLEIIKDKTDKTKLLAIAHKNAKAIGILVNTYPNISVKFSNMEKIIKRVLPIFQKALGTVTEGDLDIVIYGAVEDKHKAKAIAKINSSIKAYIAKLDENPYEEAKFAKILVDELNEIFKRNKKRSYIGDLQTYLDDIFNNPKSKVFKDVGPNFDILRLKGYFASVLKESLNVSFGSSVVLNQVKKFGKSTAVVQLNIAEMLLIGTDFQNLINLIIQGIAIKKEGSFEKQVAECVEVFKSLGREQGCEKQNMQMAMKAIGIECDPYNVEAMIIAISKQYGGKRVDNKVELFLGDLTQKLNNKINLVEVYKGREKIQAEKLLELIKDVFSNERFYITVGSLLHAIKLHTELKVNDEKILANDSSKVNRVELAENCHKAYETFFSQLEKMLSDLKEHDKLNGRSIVISNLLNQLLPDDIKEGIVKYSGNTIYSLAEELCSTPTSITPILSPVMSLIVKDSHYVSSGLQALWNSPTFVIGKGFKAINANLFSSANYLTGILKNQERDLEVCINAYITKNRDVDADRILSGVLGNTEYRDPIERRNSPEFADLDFTKRSIKRLRNGNAISIACSNIGGALKFISSEVKELNIANCTMDSLKIRESMLSSCIFDGSSIVSVIIDSATLDAETFISLMTAISDKRITKIISIYNLKIQDSIMLACNAKPWRFAYALSCMPSIADFIEKNETCAAQFSVDLFTEENVVNAFVEEMNNVLQGADKNSIESLKGYIEKAIKGLDALSLKELLSMKKSLISVSSSMFSTTYTGILQYKDDIDGEGVLNLLAKSIEADIGDGVILPKKSPEKVIEDIERALRISISDMSEDVNIQNSINIGRFGVFISSVIRDLRPEYLALVDKQAEALAGAQHWGFTAYSYTGLMNLCAYQANISEKDVKKVFQEILGIDEKLLFKNKDTTPGK